MLLLIRLSFYAILNVSLTASTSAYQVEGAAFEDGRTPSIFDTFAHSDPKPGNGDVTSDQYHKYKEDVELMAETGLDAYRFSISWSRLIPNGRGPVNPKGLEYYNNLINALITKGIQPHVTLIHSDTPQVLEDEYGGFVSPRIIEDFVAYADVCFREFGDRVLHWTTINEANIFIFGGYDVGNSPPSRCSFPFGINCTKGNSMLEPYLAAHHLLLAHASAARLYKDNYQGRQHGFIGFNLYAFDFIPFSNTTEDVTATGRSKDFFIGWFMEPLMYGDYPAIMKKNAGSKLPVFTQKETELLKESFDFIGLNYYTVIRVKDHSASLAKQTRDYLADQATSWTYLEGKDPFNGYPFKNTPWGLRGVLEHFKQAYGNPLVYIHENGQFTDHSSDYNTLLNDQSRVEYLQGHIGAILNAVRNGSNTRGYFVWSFVDMYELMFGTKYTFGLYYIDFNDPKLTRHPRLSQRWYSKFLKAGNVSIARQYTSATSSRNPHVIGLNSS
ncbi:cyanidin 3-O-glucoside 5-O-glucosyltransferase (acyl-glucose)-like isoform X1 [Silene latifolia]|uniref:cyanidin 3-O-glucoside 5-O-glucosyltransferase (acyl-glucose)-like isoform X1 n=2 Tax=Silene latifolia TaxID=37657 RepID=UPI003D785694